MQKLANIIVDRMLEARLTAKEINFLLYISRFQDDQGSVSGVHYKDVCKAMHMSYQEFYNVKDSLEEKAFIRCKKTNRIDHDITILGNIYGGRERQYESEGYVNTNHNIFYCEDFLTMKAGSKLLGLIFLKIGLAGVSGRYEIGVEKFYEKYMKILGVTRRVVRTYLKELKTFFSIEIKDKKYYITAKKVVKKKAYAKTEADNYREYNVEVICRRNRIKDVGDKIKKEMRDLLYQYKDIAIAVNCNAVESLACAVYRSLEKINEEKRGTWDRKLNIKLVHKYMRRELGIA